MRAESPHLRGYDPNFRVAVNERASTNAGCRYLRRTREPGSSRRWTTGLLLLLPLTAAISIQFVSVANAAIGGRPPRSAESSAAIQLSSCKLSGVPQPARCGVLVVPENPSRPAGRQLKIGVAVIPATGGKSRPDPIVILMGGPGEDAIGAAEIYVKQFTTLRQDRDILLVDQRGTGRSGALNCALFSAQEAAVSLRDVFPPAAVEKCEQNLRVRADLTQYTYDRFANDLEQVRQALGYGLLNLFGGSYGTRAAQVYLILYPKSVRTVYLGSVLPRGAVRMSGLSEKPTSQLKPRARSWVTIACVSNRLPASFGLRPHSRKTIANLFSHPCRLCSPLVIPTVLRRYGTRSVPPRVSHIALKSCSVGRGTPRGMNASRRSINRSSFQ